MKLKNKILFQIANIYDIEIQISENYLVAKEIY